MEWGHQEDAAAFTIFFLRVFEVGDLHDDGNGLCQIDTTENGDKQFFADDDARNGHDAAEGEAACVAHEHQCGIAVPPIETNAGPDDGGHEDH